MKLLGYEVFSLDGRLNRAAFIKLMLLTGIITTAVSVAVWLVLPALLKYFLFVAILVVYLVHFSLAARRFHDLGKGIYWAVAYLFVSYFGRVFEPVSLIHLIFFLYLLIKKGDAGPNQYGPDPLDSK